MVGTIELTPDAAGDEPPERSAFDEWFERDYPLVVGLCRRILDLGATVDASLAVAEDVALEVFTRVRRHRPAGDGSETVVLIEHALDECLERMVGHPGTVALHPELLETDLDVDGLLPLAELQETLADLRRTDRRIGLLALGGGYSPTEVALLLDHPLEEVLSRLGRISVRLADGRRIGHADPVGDAR
jgi:DNA-directed RNA polymerase specialized sigma24 family protein